MYKDNWKILEKALKFYFEILESPPRKLKCLLRMYELISEASVTTELFRYIGQQIDFHILL